MFFHGFELGLQPTAVVERSPFVVPMAPCHASGSCICMEHGARAHAHGWLPGAVQRHLWKSQFQTVFCLSADMCCSALAQVVKEDDNNWPAPDRVGKQELEIIINGQHISFTCTKLGSVLQVQQSKDPEGLRVFYYLVQVSRTH
eukprot:scaffold252042_cov24-Tisochrysis_lutea.AAC.2